MMAGTFAYIAGLPFVIVNVYGHPDYVFSIVFGLNAVGFILASQVNVRVQRRVAPERVLLAALVIQIAAAAVFVTDVLAGWTIGALSGWFAHRQDIPFTIQLLPDGFAVGFKTRF